MCVGGDSKHMHDVTVDCKSVQIAGFFLLVFVHLRSYYYVVE
jgi:hypothetical protein